VRCRLDLQNAHKRRADDVSAGPDANRSVTEVEESRLGNADSAFEWLDKAVADRSNWLVWLKLDPRFGSLRGQPRFDALLRRVGLEHQ
jgi:hypothetical protein